LKAARSGGISAGEYWQLGADLVRMRKAFLESFREAGLDALLMPATPLTALPHTGSFVSHLTPACSYTFVMNLLHWPAGVVPVTTVKAEEAYYHADADLPAAQRDKLSSLARAALAGSGGSPAGVQLACEPFEDELTLFAMGELEREAQFRARPGAI